MKMTNNSILYVLTMQPDWQSQESSRKRHIQRKQKATAAFPGLGAPCETESQNEADPAQQGKMADICISESHYRHFSIGSS